MRHAFYASLAIVPWVAFTLLLAFLMNDGGWPVGLVGTLSRVVTLPLLAPGSWPPARLAAAAAPRRGGLAAVDGHALDRHQPALVRLAEVDHGHQRGHAVPARPGVRGADRRGAGAGADRLGQLALVPVMLVGLALVTEVHKFDFGGHVVGDLMVVVAALGLAANAFVIRHIMKAMDEEAVALYNHCDQHVRIRRCSALVGGDFARTRRSSPPSPAWLPIVLLGVVAAVGLPLYYLALRRMDVWKLRTFMLATPVLTVAIEWPLWGVRLSAMQGWARLIILGGLAALIRIESRGQDVNHRNQPPSSEPVAQEPTTVAPTGASN